MTSKTQFPRMKPKFYGRSWSASGSSVSYISAIPSITAGWEVAKESAVELGAKMTKQAIDETFTMQGSPKAWAPNKPETLAMKGAGKRVMEDTGVMANSVKIVKISDMRNARGIGWFDEKHPTAVGPDGTPLSMGELAWMHELGVLMVEKTAFGDRFTSIPARPWASQAAHRDGGKIVRAQAAFLESYIAANCIGGKFGFDIGPEAEITLGEL